MGRQAVERPAVGRQLMRRRSVGWRQPMGCLYSFVAFLRLLILGGGRPWGLWVGGRRWGQLMRRRSVGRRQPMGRQPMGCLYSFLRF